MDYLVQADGTSRFSLADGSGFILLAGEPAAVSQTLRVKWQSAGRRAKWAATRRFKWRRGR